MIDLYLGLKIRNKADILEYSQEQYQKEREKLGETDVNTLMEYINTMVDVLVNMARNMM